MCDQKETKVQVYASWDCNLIASTNDYKFKKIPQFSLMMNTDSRLFIFLFFTMLFRER